MRSRSIDLELRFLVKQDPDEDGSVRVVELESISPRGVFQKPDSRMLSQQIFFAVKPEDATCDECGACEEVSGYRCDACWAEESIHAGGTDGFLRDAGVKIDRDGVLIVRGHMECWSSSGPDGDDWDESFRVGGVEWIETSVSMGDR